MTQLNVLKDHIEIQRGNVLRLFIGIMVLNVLNVHIEIWL